MLHWRAGQVWRFHLWVQVISPCLVLLIPGTAQYTSPVDAVGQLVTPSGERVGEHKGLWYYTIGQGARLAGMQSKWFVAKKGVGQEGRDVLVVPGS